MLLLLVLYGCLSALWLPQCLGWTCQVVSGFGAFAPCLEHVCAGGGGGSVANVGYCFIISWGIIVLRYIVYYLYKCQMADELSW